MTDLEHEGLEFDVEEHAVTVEGFHLQARFGLSAEEGPVREYFGQLSGLEVRGPLSANLTEEAPDQEEQ